MKTGKRFVSIFLVVLMLLTAAPLAGLVGLDLRNFDFGCMKAAAETFYSGIFKYTLNSDNEATITGSIFTKVEELTGHLSIPATIDGYPVISVGGFSKFKNLTSVSIAAGVQTIKSSAFKGTNIASVNLGTVSKIEGSAFLGCPITNIDLSYVTSLSAGAFGNTQITYVSIPIALTSIGVGTKGGPFYGSRLSSYYLENSPSRIIKGLFAGCNELKSVEIQDSIKTIEEAAFYKCEGLETVTGMKNVTRIDALAFASCKMLKNLPHMNNLSSLGAGAFVGDTSLTDFFVPASLTRVSADYSVVGIGMDTDTGAFQSTSLKNISFDTNLTRIPLKLFFRCDSLEEITFPDSITVIESAAFYKCSSLKKVFGARNVSSIGELAFGLCSSLQEFPRLSKLEKIGGAAFYNDSALTSFFIPKSLNKCGFGFNVISIGTGNQTGIFEGSGLVDVSFDDSMTTIPAGLFLECTSLKTITLPKSITTVEELAFFKCTNLQKVEGFENVESFGHMAFYLCSSLTELPLNAAIKTIGSGAFAQTQGVEEVVIPKSLSKITSGYSIVGLGSGTIFPFQNSGLKCVAFEDGYKVIQSGLLRRCKLMEKTIIPATVTKIENAAFAECELLSDVYYGGTETEWNAIIIGTNNDNLKNATIHYQHNGDDTIARYNIYAFSNKPNLAIGAHDSLEMIFQLEKVPLDGAARLVKDASFTFTSSDTSIFNIASIDRQSDMTTIRINGNHSGTAILSVSAFDQNGLKDSKKFHIVVSGETVYYADNMPSYDIDCNGITIDNFVYDKSDSDFCTISFDAYNQVNCYGAVEVWDKDDNLLYTQAIDRYDGNLLPDSLKDSFISAFSQHDFNCDYKNEEYSTKTEIYISGIPRDGHIVISNDIVSSPAAAVYNISHLAIEGISKTIKLASSLSSADKAVKEATKEVGKEVLDTIVKTADKTIRKTSTSMLKKIMTTSNYGSETGLNQTLKTYYLYLDQLDIDVVDIMLSALKKAAQGAVSGLIEKAIYELMGVPGKIAEKVFDAIGFNNLLHEAEKIGECAESGNVCIYCTPMYNEIRYSNGYMVRQSDPFDDNVSFHTYKIVNKDKRDEVSKQFEEHMIELFSMALYKDGLEVQPKGKVEVAIPVPKGVNVFHMSIYRQEADGSFTKLNLSFNGQDGYYFNDGYIYIQTDHFSLYCMTGEVTPMQTVAFSQSSVTLNVNDTFTQYPEIVPEISDDLIEDWLWQSSDESVAQVTEAGTVVAVGEGQAVISALDGAATYTVTVNPEQHTHADADNDGKCDTCGEKMTGGKHCKYCGKIHGGAFGWLVKFFHSIFAIFKR